MARSGRGGTGLIVALVVTLLFSAVLVFFLAQPRIDADPQPTSSATPEPPPHGGGVPVDENEGSEGGSQEPSYTPFISSARVSADGSTVVVHAFVPGIAEEGGQCRVILTQDDVVAETTESAYVEVATTSCPPLSVPIPPDVTGALWVVVQYTSQSGAGETERVEVTRP